MFGIIEIVSIATIVVSFAFVLYSIRLEFKTNN